LGKLIYAAITSLDGYIEDEHGDFSWGEPDEEVHGFINDLQRSVGIYLYGRKLYEVMAVWETISSDEQPSVMGDFADIWRAAEKIVYSKTIETPTTAKTRIERDFDIESVRALKRSSDADLTVGGADLATHAFKAGLIDECHLFLAPIVVGGGRRALPNNVRLELELKDERRFDSGFIYLRYSRAV
jgi:dihydrofolate reductase